MSKIFWDENQTQSIGKAKFSQETWTETNSTHAGWSDYEKLCLWFVAEFTGYPILKWQRICSTQRID